MENNQTEDLVNEINQNVFFKEFTYSKNDFKITNGNLELADHLVWLDDIFFIFQIKDRAQSENSDDEKWFQNKVINKGVKQIKSTLKYLNDYEQIALHNNKGHVFNLVKAKQLNARKVIIYTPNQNFSDEKRNLKFYESSQAGLIHLFHSEDYTWICKYLITPAEIEEYLGFRENLYQAQKKFIVALPEQYVLGHFLQTINVDHLDAKYINNLKIIDDEIEDFDMSGVINNFTKDLRFSGEVTEYYFIIREIAKLKRSELVEFKKRFVMAMEKCKLDTITTPYRIYTPRTDCAFVFIPLPKSRVNSWMNPLKNYTLAHKYTQKAGKGLGVAIMPFAEKGENYIDVNWIFVEQKWEHDPEMEELLDKNFPFRKVNTKEVTNRYNLPKSEQS